MEDFLKKQWTSLLGALFVFMALIYSFKYAVDSGWITDGIKISVGLMVGAGIVLLGLKLLFKGSTEWSQWITGLGVVILYVTFVFAGIYYSIWTPSTVFFAMIAVTVILSLLAFKYQLRILMNISLLGSLLAPLVMKSIGDQVYTLFLYLLVINIAAFSLSVIRQWGELRITSFVGTWVLYAVYYIYFQPGSSIWEVPYRYAIAAFIFYVIGLMIASYKDKLRFDGINMYMGIVNSVLFALWSIIILDGTNISYTIPILAMGILYVIAAIVVSRLTQSISAVPVMTKFFGGILLLAIAGSDIGAGSPMKPIYATYFWLILAAIFLGVAKLKQIRAFDYLGSITWVGIGLYWFFTTWSAPIGLWFGVYIPFLNTAGLAWIILAVTGFYISLNTQFTKSNLQLNQFLSITASVLAHLVVGGLLTFQIVNIWNFYDVEFMQLGLTMSVSYGIYALLLFLWGAYSNQKFFRWFGSVVLVLVALKTIFIDLSGSDTFFKIIVLMILGLISFGITAINNKWQSGEKTEEVAQVGMDSTT
jgi:hypothetical protein